jgi:hypothetical protein
LGLAPPGEKVKHTIRAFPQVEDCIDPSSLDAVVLIIDY